MSTLIDTVRCCQCQSTTHALVRLSACRHPLCTACLRQQTTNTISSGRRPSLLGCLLCGALITMGDLAAAFDDKELSAFKRLFCE